MIKFGDADAICSIWYKPEREKFLVYPTFTFNLEIMGIYQQKGNRPIIYRNINDFKGKTVGIISGFAYPQDFLNAKFFKKEDVVSDEQNFLKLAFGRIDLIICDSIVAAYTIKQNKLEDKVFRNKHNFSKGIWGYLAFSRKSRNNPQILAAKYDKAMKSMLKDGSYTRAFINYINQKPDKLPVPVKK